MGVDARRITFVGPEQRPISLLLYDLAQQLRRPRPRRRRRWLERIQAAAKRYFDRALRTLVGTRSIVTFLGVGLGLVLLGLLALPVLMVVAVVLVLVLVARKAGRSGARRIYRSVRRRGGVLYRTYLSSAIGLDRRLYDGLLSKEMQALVETVNRLDNVAAWYAPTSTLPGL